MIISTVVGLRHEANVAHVVDGTTGKTFHAQQLTEHHCENGEQHAHGHRSTGNDGDFDECDMGASLHQAATVGPQRPVVVANISLMTATIALRTRVATAQLSLYSLAPKTSPPQFA